MTDSTHPGAGNQAKYQSWRLAHERMQAAIAAGFPLEAVAIAESLVTDRLLSFVNFHGAGFNADKTTLHPVAEKAARICQEATHDAQGQALAHDDLDTVAFQQRQAFGAVDVFAIAVDARFREPAKLLAQSLVLAALALAFARGQPAQGLNI